MPLPTFSMEINKNYIKIYFFFFLHLSKAKSWAPNPSCLSQYQTEFRIFSLSFQKSKISRKKSVIHSLSQSLWGKPVLSILSTAFLLGFWLYSILCVQISTQQITKLNSYIYPLVGSNAIALGSSRFSSIRTLLAEPFSLLTSILLVPVSVQYKFRATQSTAIPSGCFSSLLTTT